MRKARLARIAYTMSMSGLATSVPSNPRGEPLFRLSVEQYHAMIDARVLSKVDPVELLEGVLIHKIPKKPRHRIALAKLRRALEPLLPAGFSLQLREPITLSDGEPEPDAAFSRGCRKTTSTRTRAERMCC